MKSAHEPGEVTIAAATLVEALGRGLPADRLVLDPDVLAAMSHDEAEWAPAEPAAAGVRARTEAEVQHVVRTCAELGAAVVPRGAGTGLSGRANAVTAWAAAPPRAWPAWTWPGCSSDPRARSAW